MSEAPKVPMAPVVPGARWPAHHAGLHTPSSGDLAVPRRGACAFAGLRQGGRRRTVGTTLRRAKVALAPLRARVVGTMSWMPSAGIVYLRALDQPLFIGLGGIRRETVSSRGVILDAAQRAAEVAPPGPTSGTGIHVSLYHAPIGLTDGDFLARVRGGEFIWLAKNDPSPLLLDPTEFLERAAANFASAQPAAGATP